jgi:hypothetical protein
VLPFNPLDKRNLGAMVAEAILAAPVNPLREVPAFEGAGIYVIYYTGNFPEYEPLAKQNRDNKFCAPIYIGKAIPEGGRKGEKVAQETRSLSKRLREHAKSIIEVAPGLDTADFYYRYLVVDDIWIPLGESMLITHFAPLWNTLLDGFGNHNPGKGRIKGMRPRWDTLHPGRSWAPQYEPRPESVEDIKRDIASRLSATSFSISSRLFTPGLS